MTPFQPETKKRTWLVLGIMALSIIALIIDSVQQKGWISAGQWGYGFSGLFLVVALVTKDGLLLRFFLFCIIAGFAELASDAWLVKYTETLTYPPGEPMILYSPAYMPFSWTVVLMEVGYIGWLLSYRWNIAKASLALLLFGAVLVPLYETWAIHAGWWSYHDTPTIFKVPRYVILAEGLLMITVPYMLRKVELSKPAGIVLWALIEGVVMLVACFVAYGLVG
ncbi:hypothetical protein KK083_31060 [Fulvivirgaceae bacterium PWU4]|uniref:DUF6989 domain-containing protein n=1 Tax=Chryseosolibacter histidini TaxID=2782349 RepID=A0AAP2DTT2_9BACT|nr:hypothetical protein [Chryseosolibacter histidini]MBT1701374.1 hypothetical protein [Chryseosolibacter histidini]